MVKYRENFKNSESAQQKPGEKLGPSPPAGAAGACNFSKPLDAFPRPRPRQNAPRNELLQPVGLLTVLRSSLDVGATP